MTVGIRDEGVCVGGGVGVGVDMYLPTCKPFSFLLKNIF